MTDGGSDEASESASWVDEHGDALFRYALLRVADRELAEELVQETFVAALESASSFERRSTIRTWLTGILKHKIADRYRRLARERTVDAGAEDEDGNNPPGSWFDERGMWRKKPSDVDLDPTALADREEFWKVLEGCLDELPSRQREAFSLRVLDDRPSEEVTQILSVKANNLWVMLHRARARLRDCLEKRWFAEEGGGA